VLSPSTVFAYSLLKSGLLGAYYRDASSVDSLLAVRIPFFAINAKDDPASNPPVSLNLPLTYMNRFLLTSLCHTWKSSKLHMLSYVQHLLEGISLGLKLGVVDGTHDR
jgi:hypothetical protein